MIATGSRCKDTKASMLSGIAQQHNTRSRLYWFTEFCNSQRLSHFAAPFIVVQAETSIAESCLESVANNIMHNSPNHSSLQTAAAPKHQNNATPICYPRNSTRETQQCCPHPEFHIHNSRYVKWMRANDPSAGSPTETLLRLLLPLSDKVH